MDKQDMKELLQQVADGKMNVDDALLKLKRSPLKTSVSPIWITTEACARERRR